MSSTTNTQGLLTNVFRPSSVYDTTSRSYTTKLKLVNLDNVTANVITGFSGSFGDASCNVYLGVNAGNSYSNANGSSNNVFVGINAGTFASNTTNAVLLGYGTGYTLANGSNSILIGANTIGGSSNNIFLGPNINQAGTVSNLLYIGSGRTNAPAITADLSSVYGHVGIGTLPDTTSLSNLGLEVYGYAYIGKNSTGGLGINKVPGGRTLDVNGDMAMSDGIFNMLVSSDQTSSNSTFLFDTVNPGKIAKVQSTGGFCSKTGAWISTGNGTTSNIVPPLAGVFVMAANSGTTFATIQGMWNGSAFTQTVAPASTNGFTLASNASYIVMSNTSLGAATVSYSFTYFATS